MPKHLLVIGFGQQGSEYITKAKQLGLHLSAVEHRNKQNDPALQPILAQVDAMHWVDHFQAELLVDLAVRIHRDTPLDGIIGFSESQIYPATLAAEALGLPSPGLYATTLSRNKALQRALLQKDGLPAPGFYLASNADELAALPAEGKHVVKPINQSGSIGVMLIEHQQDLRHYAGRDDVQYPVLVEQFVGGQEYSIESLVRNGQILFENITLKEVTPPPYCVEKSHTVPAPIPTALEQELLAVSRQLIGAVRMETGIVHLEVKHDGEQAYVIEFAVRMPGDFIMDCIGLAYGFSVFEQLIRLSLNEEPQLPAEPPQVGYVEFITPQPGLITAVQGLEEAANEPGIQRLAFFMTEGQHVGDVTSSLRRPGYYIGRFADHADWEQKRERMNRLIRIVTEQ